MSPEYSNTHPKRNRESRPMPHTAAEPLLRLRQLSEVINVPPRTLARWTAEKRIPSFKVGASRFYHASRVLDSLNNFEERPK